jgi:hypothetical protein
MKRRLRRATGSVPTDDWSLGCGKCARTVYEFTAMAEKWRYWSDGRRLVPICPDGARLEFALDAPASGG